MIDEPKITEIKFVGDEFTAQIAIFNGHRAVYRKEKDGSYVFVGILKSLGLWMSGENKITEGVKIIIIKDPSGL